MRVLLVLSGKGGVGKSTMAAQLALALASCGNNRVKEEEGGEDVSGSNGAGGKQAFLRVGVLDADLTGPSMPRVLGCGGSVRADVSTGRWTPVLMDLGEINQPLAVMSIGFLLPDADAPVVWRGPKKTAMIGQLLSNVDWGDLDWLVIDTPPGTGDEHISLLETLRAMPELFPLEQQQAVLVTTPQAVAVGDVLREATFCKKLQLPIAGVIENMSGFVCPTCSECTNIFSSGGGELLAERAGCAFLGRIPIDPLLGAASDASEESALRDFSVRFRESPSGAAVRDVCDKLLGITQVE